MQDKQDSREKIPFLSDDEALLAIEGEEKSVTSLVSELGERAFLKLRAFKEKMTRTKKGPRVLILPGVLGSRLGIRGTLKHDLIWLDPFDIRRGNLDMIALREDGSSETQDLGVLLSPYLKLQVWLRSHGHRAKFHAYDWRRPVHQLGKQLAKRIQESSEEEFQLVCHSYGGLVARSALAQGAEKVSRIITLGTPHLGAWASTMVLRGSHPIIQRLAALDKRQDPKSLVERVFSTFPSSYFLLPSPEVDTSLALYDPELWPIEGARPMGRLLQAAKADWETMPAYDDRILAVAGIGYPTPGAAVLTANGFRYPLRADGDGTVLVSSAAPQGGWYARAGHGFLPFDQKVLDALPDLLSKGATDKLSKKVSDLPEVPEATDDFGMAQGFQELVQSLKQPSAQTFRNLLREYAAPADEEVVS